MQKPSVSIILPVYRVEKYIRDCLDSIVAQNYTGDIECIIVDDCGGDTSMSIVEEFIATYHGSIRFKIVHHDQNRGLSAARNTGINEAEGEFLLFVDSDDELTSNALSSLTAPLTKEYIDFVIGDYRVTGTDIIYSQVTLDDGCSLKDEDVFLSYLRGEWYMMAWNKLVNRHFIKHNGLYFLEGIIHEDDLWSFSLALKAQSMYVTKDCCYIYKIREGSITTSAGKNRRFESQITIREKIYDIIKNNNLSYNCDLNNFLQSHDLELLKKARTEFGNEAFATLYHKIRKKRINCVDLIRANGFNLRKYVRDSHLFFPETIGCRIANRITKYLLRK